MTKTNLHTILNQIGTGAQGVISARIESAKQNYCEAILRLGRPATVQEMAEATGRAVSAVASFIRNNPGVFDIEVVKTPGSKKPSRRYWPKVTA